MAELLDLQAEQCPHVMSLVRTALLRAVEAGFVGQVQIRTIESSVPDKLKVFIRAMDSKISLANSTSSKIDSQRRAELLATEDISEHQLAHIDSEQLITLEIGM